MKTLWDYLKREGYWWTCRKKGKQIQVAAEGHPKGGGFTKKEAVIIIRQTLNTFDPRQGFNVHGHLLITGRGNSYYVEVYSGLKELTIELPFLKNKSYKRTSKSSEINYFIG